MNFRNDLCCKNKFAFDMESAADRWGTHPGEAMYVCQHCGFVHFARNNESRIDRAHARALRSNAPPTKSLLAKQAYRAERKKARFQPRHPSVYGGQRGSCRVAVWQAKGISIGELMQLKSAPIVSR